MLIVCNKGSFYTYISHFDIEKSKLYLEPTEERLKLCIEISCHNEMENDENVAEFMGKVKYVLIKEEENKHSPIRKVFNMGLLPENYAIKYYYEMCEELKRGDVLTYNIGFPSSNREFLRTDRNIKLALYERFMYTPGYDENVKKIIKKVSKKSYDEVKNDMLMSCKRIQFYGNNSKTIFLVGPCIVSGEVNPVGEDLPEILYNIVKEYGYNVERVFIPVSKIYDFKKAVLEKDIKRNDIVIFFNIFKKGSVDIDAEELFADDDSGKFMYQDTTIHTTVYGNVKLAEAILDRIVLPVYKTIDESRNSEIVYKGRRQFTIDEEKKIKDYLKDLKGEAKSKNFHGGLSVEQSEVGCIVMNCNPFTKGHLYLIETACKQVDFLYIFVEEEDASYFPFCDRIAMVREGTKHLDNIAVIPSGKFILSKVTFQGYFDKEVAKEYTDASADLEIFANYVAPVFGITKRFVGEEPFDLTTRGYNEAMKERMPEADVEIVEIPRGLVGGKVVSATEVRKLLSVRAWDEAETLLPNTTIKYLHKHLDEIEELWINKRCAMVFGGRQFDTEWLKENALKAVRNYFAGNSANENEVNVDLIIWGAGKNGKMLASSLHADELERCVFCDKTINSSAEFFGRPLLYPKEALVKYSRAAVFIASTAYKDEIYNELLDKGIEKERILF